MKALSSIANAIAARCDAVPHPATAGQRKIVREYVALIRDWDAKPVKQLTRELQARDRHKWIVYQLLASHSAFRQLTVTDFQRMGKGLDSWWTVDAFARTLTGPAWLLGQLRIGDVRSWMRSENRWWRRIALVSTVALNMRSQGGLGDTRQTLSICKMAVHDRDDMVVKALSWALRALVVHDAPAVREFLGEHSGALASRVRREVGNKLTSGLKNPGRPAPRAAAAMRTRGTTRTGR